MPNFERGVARKRNWNIMKQTLDLDEVLDVLGVKVISKTADELTSRCPLPSHSGADTNPSFAVNTKKLAYNCFVCGGGSIPQLVMECEGLDWEEALEWLVPYVGAMARNDPEMFSLAIKRKLYFEEEPEAGALPYFKPNVLYPWMDGPFDYYFDRGIPEETCRKFVLCYDSAYTKYNRKTKTEWVGQAAIVPHFFEDQLVGYQSRIVGEKPEGMPKWDNTSDFPKSDTLYNYDRACRDFDKHGQVFVVEASLTAAYIDSLGGLAVGTFGATVSDTQMNLLRMFPQVVLAFDNDTAGRIITRKVAEALKKRINVRIMIPLEGDKADLNDLVRGEAHEHMKLTVPASLYDYYVE